MHETYNFKFPGNWILVFPLEFEHAKWVDLLLLKVVVGLDSTGLSRI